MPDARPQERQRFVVVSSHRSGSTMLVRALDSCPEIECFGELFARFTQGRTFQIDHSSRRRARFVAIDADFMAPDGAVRYAARKDRWRDLLDGLAASAQPGVRLFGFKLMFGQATEIVAAMARDPAWRVVVLRRDNLLAMYASLLVHHLPDGAPQGVAVPFDAAEFDAFAARVNHAFDDFRGRLESAGKTPVEVRYAELLARRGAERVCAELGVTPDRRLRIRTERLGSADILSRFANPDAARAHLERIGKPGWAREEPEPAPAP